MKEFQTDTFIIRIHDNLLKEFVVKKNKTLQISDLKESMQITTNYKPGVKFYVLLEGEENVAFSGETRRAAASEEYSQYNAALALCSKSTYHAIMGNLFLKISKPKVPTRFFEQRDAAIKWLEEQMKSNK